MLHSADMAGLKIEEVTLREIRLPLVNFFETSFGRVYERRVLLLELRTEASTGWGECVADDAPRYSYETVDTAWAILKRFVVPTILGCTIEDPDELSKMLKSIRGHSMAKACVESAFWDAQAKSLGVPLWQFLGGTRSKIPCGVSIGIQDSPEELLRKIEKELRSGYQRIKIKIKPGWDTEIVREVRRRFPKIPLMVDANSAYTAADFDRLRELDQFDLMMIEQPLAHDDVFLHGKLQDQIQTPICLDESIRHSADALQAIELEACRIINIKMGRLGGHAEARRTHDLCQSHQIPVWCGGMLETGIGRAHNVALSTLQNFTLPGDVTASHRYFRRDTIRPSVEVTADGHIIPSDEAGIGYEPDIDWIRENMDQYEVFTAD